jgi:parallel beta-helix repeat protein
MSDNVYGLFLDGLSRDNKIEENKVKNNSGVGIYIRPGITGNEVGENTALGNAFLDLQDDNPNCDDNEWEDNRFDTANQDCID